MRFTTHDSQVQQLFNELKAKEPNLTDRERKQLELFTQGLKEKDLITSHKMEYAKAGYDPETGKKMAKQAPVVPPTHVTVPKAVVGVPAVTEVATHVRERVEKVDGRRKTNKHKGSK